MNQAIDINAGQRKTILGLLGRYLPNTTAWVYGSRVKWTSRPQSDLDMVVFASPEQERQVFDLREAFEESNLPFRVDLFVWDSVPEQFQEQIDADHVVLVAGEQKMVGEWNQVKLGDCIIINDSTYSKKEAWPFINYLDTGNVTDNHISDIHFLIPEKDKIPSRARRKVGEGDIVYSTVRPNKRHFGMMKDIPDNFLASTGFAVIRGKDGIACTEFVYWFLVQDHIVDQLHTIAEHSTSAYPSIKPNDIEQIQFRLPSLPEQRAIAHVLTTLDDKIELNRRINETLEEMARALFKSWFVDFDPVRAKMKGRETGLPPDVADLFPDKLVDSKLGKIPEGWEVKVFGDLVSQLRENVNPLKFPATKFNHFSIPAYAEGQTPKRELGENIKSTKTRVPPGSVLLSKLNPEIERVWLVDVMEDETAICSTEFLVLHPKPPIPRSYIYCLLRHPIFREQIKSLVTGTSKSHQRARADAIKKLEVIFPSKPIVDAFESIASKLLNHGLACLREIRTLVGLRDALLPGLMSGELRVDNPETLTTEDEI